MGGKRKKTTTMTDSSTRGLLHVFCGPPRRCRSDDWVFFVHQKLELGIKELDRFFVRLFITALTGCIMATRLLPGRQFRSFFFRYQASTNFLPLGFFLSFFALSQRIRRVQKPRYPVCWICRTGIWPKRRNWCIMKHFAWTSSSSCCHQLLHDAVCMSYFFFMLPSSSSWSNLHEHFFLLHVASASSWSNLHDLLSSC